MVDAPAALVERIAAIAAQKADPFVVAIDGKSGAGKTTIADAVAKGLNAALISGDDFFAGGTALRDDPPEKLVADCINWRSQREVLEALRSGITARYRPFDWNAFDGSLSSQMCSITPRDIIVLEGVYSARPELCDLWLITQFCYGLKMMDASRGWRSVKAN